MLRLRSIPSTAQRLMGLRLAIVVTALSFFAAAIAQGPVLSPRSIVVNPIPGFEVDVWLDKDQSGRDAPAYRVGESLRISVRPSVDAYVYLFSLAADGEVVQVLPNRYDADGSNNYVRGGTVRTFPPSGARYTFNVAPPQGLAKVIAVASRRPLDVSTLATFRSERDFATSNIGEDAFARALRIIVTPIPSTDWVSATALYYVGSRPQVGAYGTLRVDSDPRRGEVYVDRTFVGYTPLDYDLRPGTYDVEVVLTKARDYGIVQLTLGGEPLGAPVDLYNYPHVQTTGVLTYKDRKLAAGKQPLVLEIAGANPSATKNYMVGLDYVRLRRKPAR